MQPQSESFESRSHVLYSLYANLESKYSNLSLACRCYLYGNHKSHIDEIRGLAEAKFFLAAILEWSPTSNVFRIQRLQAKGGAVASRVDCNESTVSELCPLWIFFFDDVLEVDEILSGKREVETSTRGALHVELLLQKAEMKYEWIQHLFNLVSGQGDYVQGEGHIMLEPWMVFAGRNRFCGDIVNGCGLINAVMQLRQFGNSMASETPHAHLGKDGKRYFFPVSTPADFQPWLKHLAKSTTLQHQLLESYGVKSSIPFALFIRHVGAQRASVPASIKAKIVQTTTACAITGGNGRVFLSRGHWNGLD